MQEPEQIEHQGIIKKIDGNEIDISIVSIAACASCSAKGVCSASDVEEKIVQVKTENAADYDVNETVDIYYKQSLGFRALFLGYLLPFLIVMATLITIMVITGSEGTAGLVSLLTLVPYYLVLHFTKDKLKETFSFSIKKSYPKLSTMTNINFS